MLTWKIIHSIHLKEYTKCSGVARAFSGGQLAHPESQNEEENK